MTKKRNPAWTYVPEPLKTEGWTAQVPMSVANWSPERNAMLWICQFDHSIDEVEELYRKWLDEERKKQMGAPLLRLLSSKCHHGRTKRERCPDCERWHQETLDYLAQLRVRVAEYHRREEDASRRREAEAKRRREEADRQRKHDAKQGQRPQTGHLELSLAVLGLSPGYSMVELKAAYKAAVKSNHPDKVASEGAEAIRFANARLQAINEAFAKLEAALKQSA